MTDLQGRLDEAVDKVLDALQAAEEEGVELDPLQTIFARMKARGAELDVSGLPPVAQMFLSGLGQ
jgi:hypothetical protein